MSASLFKGFAACEASALAQLKGDWKPTSNPTALLVGNYIHSYFESKESHEKFVDENKEAMQTRSGAFRAPYKHADKMIEVLEADPFFMNAYQGDKEVIVTGDLFGKKWKGKIDCLNLDKGYFVDLKTTADIHKRFWSIADHKWVSFIESYDYVLQMAVYTELIRQTFGVDCTCFIMAVSKQDPPDHAAIYIEPERFQERMEFIRDYQPRVQQILAGEIEPEACGTCEYCRTTKKLKNFITIDDLID
ncbi:hypothetical protein IV38_GL000093 [Lactobacillus selangorensis]|uniref:Putative exodeoxyribonuclease 8 PDDEXK-like domain-containing protein n=2 Tax=Lactobacillus selangorensis TaxID=81857 RepID=A0A0R2FYS3_9LACO|nr:hypothetical protein IV38_GL000093 [Lactobacillus selangorensis]KRN31429.1 hypothetical protein IV40_GL001425 [Lactobacillus selangorensis]